MLSGYYTIASGMMTNQKDLDVISNNLLNLETAGFRAERPVISAFEKEMMTVSSSAGQKVLGDGVGAPVTVVSGEQTSFAQGDIEPTGRSLDLAIDGAGFFEIAGEDGTIFLTRSGNFDLDTEGYLVLPGTGRVLGEDGYLKASDAGAEIAPDGTLSSPSGKSLGKLLVVSPEDNASLTRTRNGLFTSEGALTSSEAYQLVQGSLEKSNVDLNVELTNLVAAQRAFQSCSSALSTVDMMNRRAAEQIGAV